MAALVAIGAIAGLYRWGLPLLAATLTPHIPLSWEEQLGQAAVAALAPPEVRCTDQESLNALRRITERLTDAQAPLPYRIQVYLVDRPIVNALAAPGGGSPCGGLCVSRAGLARRRHEWCGAAAVISGRCIVEVWIECRNRTMNAAVSATTQAAATSSDQPSSKFAVRAPSRRTRVLP